MTTQEETQFTEVPMVFPGIERMTSDRLFRKDGFIVNHSLCGLNAATSGNYGTFFIARHPCEVQMVQVVFESNSTSGTLHIERLTGTTAPGAGDNIYSTSIDLSSTANTVITREKFELNGNRKLKQGERLALIDGGILTGLSNLVVSVYFTYTGNGDYR